MFWQARSRLPWRLRGAWSAPSLQVSSFPYAKQGDTIPVTLTVKSTTKVVVDWKIFFPKSTVSAVVIYRGKNLIVTENTDNFVVGWKSLAFKGNPVTVQIDVTLRTDVLGDQSLVTVTNGRGTQLGHNDILVLAPNLWVAVGAPQSVIRGGEAFSIEIYLSNPSSLDLAFDLAPTVYFAGTNRNIEYSYIGGNVYGFDGASDGATLYWSGVVPAGQTFSLRIQTASGLYPGTFPLFGLKDLLDPNKVYGTMLIIVQ